MAHKKMMAVACAVAAGVTFNASAAFAAGGDIAYF